MAGRIVVVTGASGGIGRAVVRELAARGDRVALLARGETGLAAAAGEVAEYGGQALVVPVDVSDAEALDAAAEQVENRLGPIDVWVNVAFTSVFARFGDVSPEEYRRVTEVTYLGYVYGTMAALRRMKLRDRGTIVHVGSALAYRGVPLQTAYCGAKHAIQGFHESLRTELMHDGSGIQVTMVQLPAVNTPQFRWVRSRLPHKAQPVPPIYQPEVAARAIVHAIDHPARREWWVGSSTVGTLLANAVAPALLDRYLARTGFADQQVDEPEDEGRPDNLFAPLDGAGGRDFGAHGTFDDRAKDASVQQWLSHRAGPLTAGAGVLLAGGLAAVVTARRR
jgi:NAD(P)-dependent dehydrogenase (short-subunit alcohol dehydrogenase family)